MPSTPTTLEPLETQLARLTEPSDLLALAMQIDQLGQTLTQELVRDAAVPARVGALRPLLLGVPRLYARTLLRAAERYDDLGSPKRAIYVLLEALGKSFDSATVETVAEALGFTLDAHDQPAAAAQLRTLIAARLAPRGGHEQLVLGLTALRATIDWNALDDELAGD